MAVARVSTVTASSPEGFQEAIAEALNRANKTLRGLTELEVASQKATLKDGKIDEYWVTVNITFILE